MRPVADAEEEVRTGMANAPYMYWVGMNTAPDLTPEEEKKFSDFYSNTHAHEVVASNDGFIRATRYEKLEGDPRNDHGPRWLAMYEMNSKDAADCYIEHNDGPPEGRPKYTPGLNMGRQTGVGGWRLIWRRHAPVEGDVGTGGAPYIMLIGMDVPPGTDAEGMKQFDEFYTNTHVPEVVRNSNFIRGTRYEMYRQFSHPEPGSPRFLALYEGDEKAMQTRAERRANPGSGPKSTSGPPPWEAHDTMWRLIYKRVDSYEKPADASADDKRPR